jgi:hypothetical protein
MVEVVVEVRERECACEILTVGVMDLPPEPGSEGQTVAATREARPWIPILVK